MLSFACITPHPPIIVPGIGRGRDLKTVEKTIGAMEKLREQLEKSKPETIVIISPHAPTEPGSFGINAGKTLKGNLLDFGLEKSFEFDGDLELAQKIYVAASAKEISVNLYESLLDHGSLVPLFYLTQNFKLKLVRLSFSYLDLDSHFDYGKIIGDIFRTSPKKIAVVASGDLSHRLTPEAPAGYSPQGKEFDRKLIDILSRKNIAEIFKLDKNFIEEAGECGLRSIIILLGILGKENYRFDLLNYEGPFGVGYLVARLL